MSADCDVLVAGGGPAGLAVAVRCALAGLSVLVAEVRPFPVDKACGEGLMPAAVRRLAAIGVRPEGHPLRGIRYRDAGHSVDAPFRGASGLGVRRTVLHGALSARAAALGVPVLTGRVTGFTQDRDGVTVRADGGGGCGAGCGPGEFRARYLVAADGLHSPLRRLCGLEPGPARRPRFGLRRHYRIAPWTDLVEVHWAADAEAYVTPVTPDVAGIAILGTRGGGFDDRLAAFPELRERVAGAPVVSGVRGAGPLRQDVPRRTAGRVLLAGDAAGYLDALTGEGLGSALAQAEVLAGCLAAGRPGDYERGWRRATRMSRLLTGGLLWSRHQPLLAPRIVPSAARLPWLFTAIVNQVARALSSGPGRAHGPWTAPYPRCTVRVIFSLARRSAMPPVNATLLARALLGDTECFGEVGDDRFHVVAGDIFGARRRTGQSLPLKDVTLGPPLTGVRFVNVMGGFIKPGRTRRPDRQPRYLPKQVNGVSGDGAPVVYPSVLTGPMQMEAELAVVVGRTLSKASPGQARESIFGWSVYNDWTAAEYGENGYWATGKSIDGFASWGPWIRTDLTEERVMEGLSVTGTVNGERVQEGNTRYLIFTPSETLSHISHRITLFPGDVVALGTPPPAVDVQVGDHVVCEVEEVGVLRNDVVGESAG